MIAIYIFLALQAVASTFAVKVGGGPEKAVALQLPAAFALTSLAREFVSTQLRSVELLLLGVDISLLAGLLLVAVRANRWWPMWLVSLHVVAILVHGVRGLDPSILPIVYANLTGYMGFPICGVLILGTVSYVSRTRRDGCPPSDWSTFRW